MIPYQKKIVFEGRFVHFFVHKFLNGNFLPFFQEVPSFIGLKNFFIQIFFQKTIQTLNKKRSQYKLEQLVIQ